MSADDESPVKRGGDSWTPPRPQTKVPTDTVKSSKSLKRSLLISAKLVSGAVVLFAISKTGPLLAPNLALLFVSTTYFLAASVGTPLRVRIVASAHGVAGAIIYFAVFAASFAGISSDAAMELHKWLQIVPVAFIVFSFELFRGPKVVHLLQLVNVVALLWNFVILSMVVTGSYL